MPLFRCVIQFPYRPLTDFFIEVVKTYLLQIIALYTHVYML